MPRRGLRKFLPARGLKPTLLKSLFSMTPFGFESLKRIARLSPDGIRVRINRGENLCEFSFVERDRVQYC